MTEAPALLRQQQKPVRYRGQVRGVLVGVRLQPEQLAIIDALRLPTESRADVIRYLIEAHDIPQ